MIEIKYFLLSKNRGTSVMTKISMLRVVYPLPPPQKDYDFDGFLHFLEKLKRYLQSIYDLSYKMTGTIFPVILRGGHLQCFI